MKNEKLKEESLAWVVREDLPKEVTSEQRIFPSFIWQIFIEYLICVGHYDCHWGL